jgi:hypothetical protein
MRRKRCDAYRQNEMATPIRSLQVRGRFDEAAPFPYGEPDYEERTPGVPSFICRPRPKYPRSDDCSSRPPASVYGLAPASGSG